MMVTQTKLYMLFAVPDLVTCRGLHCSTEASTKEGLMVDDLWPPASYSWPPVIVFYC